MKGISAMLLFLSFSLACCTGSKDKPLDKAIDKINDTSSSVVVPEKTAPEVYTVEISGMKFMPDVVNVHKGDTVLWINKDLVTHCVTEAATKAYTSSNIPTGTSWKMVVNNSSDYYCAIHPVMKGKIVVD